MNMLNRASITSKFITFFIGLFIIIVLISFFNAYFKTYITPQMNQKGLERDILRKSKEFFLNFLNLIKEEFLKRQKIFFKNFREQLYIVSKTAGKILAKCYDFILKSVSEAAKNTVQSFFDSLKSKIVPEKLK